MKVSLFRLALYSSLAAAWLVVTPANFAQNDFVLNVSVITSEHSRDSNSVTRILRVAANTLVYEETYQGARANRRPPLKREYQLKPGDRDRLISLLKGKRLIKTRAIAKSSEQSGPLRDFEVSIATKLAGKQGLISIKAPRTATELRTDPLYQGSVLLIAELYRIIGRTDPEIRWDELIR
jgi:hypothetical protein